jgi:superfamily II DNA or RNA helicase
MSLLNANIKIKYQSFIDNPVKDFYIPVLERSIVYKRAVGYFSSSILIDYIKGLRSFFKNDGQIQLIISPYLSSVDKRIVETSNSIVMTKIMLESLFRSFISDQKSFTAAKLLFMLVKTGKMEIRVAEPKNTSGLFHDKIGLFVDGANNKVAIIGSNNETSSAVFSNVESFNTFCSWKNGQEEYVNQHEKDFQSYWNDENPSISLYSLNEALDSNLIQEFDTQEPYEDLYYIITEERGQGENLWSVNPYDFQRNAVDVWWKSKRGIFKFATGSGKTKTAIYLMERMEREYRKNFFIIVVPDKTLVNQWGEELESYNKRVIRCFSANSNWQTILKDKIEISKIEESYNYYVVVTNDSYLSQKFQRELSKIGDNYLIVVDECHSWGTETILNNLPNPTYRLGLSATPELFFSQSKTERLLDFFGGIIAEYSLEDAINDQRLVGYEYYPHIVELTQEEKEKYNILTRKIVRLIGNDIDDMSDKFIKYNKYLEILLFDRARVIYGAKNKLEGLRTIVPPLAKQKNLIIYCGPTSYINEKSAENEKDSITQLESVNKLLGEIGVKFAQYTSRESEIERKNALRAFTSGDYSTLVAIKCLDEGVNIPQIERAIIMASSTNPREFIQRRGRILRTYPGKSFSEIHDFVVIDDDYPLLCKKEISRVYEFSRLALNKDSLYNHLNNKFSDILKEVEING